MKFAVYLLFTRVLKDTNKDKIYNNRNKISLREAAHMQSIFNESDNNNVCICNCKKGCRSNVCPCKKKSLNCTTRCHSSKPCFNRIV